MDPKDFVHRHKKISSAAALFEKREYSRAALLYEELLKEFPKSPRLLGQLGLCRLFTGDPAGGEARLREALKIDPDSGLVLVALGNISLARGDGRAAEGFYLRALDADRTTSKLTSISAYSTTALHLQGKKPSRISGNSWNSSG